MENLSSPHPLLTWWVNPIFFPLRQLHNEEKKNDGTDKHRCIVLMDMIMFTWIDRKSMNR